MALPSTLFRFTIDLSDVDRGVYERVELRVAKHPSESTPFMLTRVIAYLLNYEDGIAFTGGISSPNEPAIWVKDLTGVIKKWIDIGNPSAHRLHKASKASQAVCIYTYKDPKFILEELGREKVYGAEAIQIFYLADAFLTRLEETVKRDNVWQFLLSESEITLNANGVSTNGALLRFQ